RKRGLEARHALLAFQAFEERGFLAADISARSAMQVDLVIPAGAASVFANETRLVGLVDRELHVRGFVVELAANIDVAGVGTHREAGDETPFQQQMPIEA